MTVSVDERIGEGDKKEKESKKDGPKTKVVIRRLPPAMTESELLEQLSPLPQHDYFAFMPADYSLGQFAVSRAYIHFLDVKDLITFRDMFDGYVFVDTKGNESQAIVELAPNQKFPKKKRRDPKCGTIDDDPEYKEFLEKLKNPDKGDVTTIEACLEKIEIRDKDRKDKSKTKTPLIEFLAWRAEEKNRRRDERRKLVEDRRRRRDEDRKRRVDEERRWRKMREEQKRKPEPPKSARGYDDHKEPIRRFSKETRGLDTEERPHRSEQLRERQSASRGDSLRSHKVGETKPSSSVYENERTKSGNLRFSKFDDDDDGWAKGPERPNSNEAKPASRRSEMGGGRFAEKESDFRKTTRGSNPVDHGESAHSASARGSDKRQGNRQESSSWTHRPSAEEDFDADSNRRRAAIGTASSRRVNKYDEESNSGWRRGAERNSKQDFDLREIDDEGRKGTGQSRYGRGFDDNPPRPTPPDRGFPEPVRTRYVKEGRGGRDDDSAWGGGRSSGKSATAYASSTSRTVDRVGSGGQQRFRGDGIHSGLRSSEPPSDGRSSGSVSGPFRNIPAPPRYTDARDRRDHRDSGGSCSSGGDGGFWGKQPRGEDADGNDGWASQRTGARGDAKYNRVGAGDGRSDSDGPNSKPDIESKRDGYSKSDDVTRRRNPKARPSMQLYEPGRRTREKQGDR